MVRCECSADGKRTIEGFEQADVSGRVVVGGMPVEIA
jgi:hypothetical protein